MARGEVLVAIMNNERDWRFAQEQHWYRIPVRNAQKWLRECWPPKWIAFYQTKVFGTEAHAITYYAEVQEIRTATRKELIPEAPANHPKAHQDYYQLIFGSIQRLEQPILSRRLRRIVFIPTTLEKFHQAVEINDLWDESPLENKLWALFKRLGIDAERQYAIDIGEKYYLLDFAIFCNKGKIDVEVDGDRWHNQSEQVISDKERDNDLATKGWQVLRFTSKHINEEPMQYCATKIKATVERLGGFEDAKSLPIRLDWLDPAGPRQLSLFDD